MHAAIGAMQGYQQDGFDFVPNKTSKAHSFLDGSAFAKMPYRPYDICAIKSFECAATCHYNFLDSLANNDLDKYDFGVWDFHAFEYLRWSINTILFKGSDLNRVKVPDDDEEFISKTLPQSKGRHCGAVGSSAIVVHLAYITQRGVQLEERTHLLQHYEVLAEKLHGPLLPL